MTGLGWGSIAPLSEREKGFGRKGRRAQPSTYPRVPGPWSQLAVGSWAFQILMSLVVRLDLRPLMVQHQHCAASKETKATAKQE